MEIVGMTNWVEISDQDYVKVSHVVNGLKIINI